MFPCTRAANSCSFYCFTDSVKNLLLNSTQNFPQVKVARVPNSLARSCIQVSHHILAYLCSIYSTYNTFWFSMHPQISNVWSRSIIHLYARWQPKGHVLLLDTASWLRSFMGGFLLFVNLRNTSFTPLAWQYLIRKRSLKLTFKINIKTSKIFSSDFFMTHQPIFDAFRGNNLLLRFTFKGLFKFFLFSTRF